MDQDSSNGSEPDKRNWRERLGIGAAEMPKLSNEFRDDSAAAPAAKPAPRAPQPVTKPAPMAPRRPAAAAATAASATAVPPASSRATPKAPDNATQDALAEKLRAQRAAAEKLAEQRVQAARNRAEGKISPAAEPPSLGGARQLGLPPSPRSPGAVPSASAGRPKFSFADEPSSRLGGDNPSARTGLGAGAPLVPPRPALGGERGQPPFLRPSAAASGLSGRTPPSPYRPSEPGAGYGGSPRLQLPASPRAGLGGEASPYGSARVPARRPTVAPPAFDPYARQPENRDMGEDDYTDEGRQPPRLGRPVPAARGREPEDTGFDEVFEDEGALRQRPSARDYQAAYHEEEGAFGDERRRSSGPWLLLLALLAAALATGAVVWFYSGGMKNLANIGGGSDSVPVVSSPETPSKVAPEGTSDTGGDAPAARKKQIYDRIVGEQEVTDGAQVQPTEETPVAPADAQPADQVPKVEPAAGATQIPAPDAATQGTTGQGLPDVEEPPPLPVPPAGNGQEGSLTQKPLNQVASAAEQAVQGAAAPPPPLPDTQQTQSSATTTPPPPEKATDGAALVSEAVSSADTAAADAAAADKAEEAKAAEEKAAAEKAAAAKAAEKKKAAEAAAKKKVAAAKKKAVDYDNLGAQPVVLVPPSKTAATAQPEVIAPTAPAAEVVEAVPAPTKKKTIFNLFGGNSGTAAAPQAGTQVAAVPQQAAVPQAATGGGGYVAQVASFRSDEEARQEYLRLKGAYPAVVGGLAQQIRPANVGGSTRYQLALGPMGSRAEASSVCSALISAGESDCIVRGP